MKKLTKNIYLQSTPNYHIILPQILPNIRQVQPNIRQFCGLSEYHNFVLYVSSFIFDHLLPNTLYAYVIIGQYLMLLDIHKHFTYVNCFMFEQLLPNILYACVIISHTWESQRMTAEVNKYMSDSFECRSWRSHFWGLCIHSIRYSVNIRSAMTTNLQNNR